MTDITQIARDETATEDISDLAGQEENAGLDIETSNLSIGSRPVARFLAGVLKSPPSLSFFSSSLRKAAVMGSGSATAPPKGPGGASRHAF